MLQSLSLNRLMSGAAALALLLTLTGCYAPSIGGQPGGSSVRTSSSASEPEEPPMAAYASYPYFTDKQVTEEDHNLILSNDESNRYAFVYTISLGKKILYKSAKIRPGENEAWDILSSCGKSCTLTITISAWSLSDDEEQNSVIQTIKLTIPEQKAETSATGSI